MRVAIRTTSGPAGEEFSLEEIRVRQEQKLLAALESWEGEKKRLEEAMSRAEAKEREFRETAEEVKKRLEAIDLVAGLAHEMEPASRAQLPEPTAQELPPAAEEKPHADFNVHATSRPLFTREVRAGLFSLLR
jgi:hypothetical protein